MIKKVTDLENSGFEFPKCLVKSNVVTEYKPKSKKIESPNRFQLFNNYNQCEKSIDFNREIVCHATPSNILAEWEQPSNYNREHSKEPISTTKVGRCKTGRTTTPTTTIVGDSVVQRVLGDKLSRSLTNKYHFIV